MDVREGSNYGLSDYIEEITVYPRHEDFKTVVIREVSSEKYGP